ncbi:hypothetical protein TTHERM_01164140 (macronuclear) [Tetrahymena thermophila SB210]|uniref:Uncharacterized protein n=1 Tax=Tetrahymena thermophila (strain SB210) TaxID=312017 RepID=Q22AS4_TETTS|nr:hypothetical protein TTHERM_01164140 [Tetrahymena thermophila SB210]EAR82394.1 hypothetical protein TTHERM_01164140 [Tetrahymena thermophila SB210]|eukprot:XP_001030057.1 hypothetical protein TTHERM_01164140 [Tetrahymena thermophila SB210]
MDPQQKFLLLKKKLDSLNYCYPFTIESAAMVERLLNENLKISEMYQNVKKQNNEALKNIAKAEQSLEPLKKENAKLIKENNDLHYAMIKVKEDAELANNRWKTTYNSLEGEKNDLKFLVDQKEARIRKVEDENLALKTKLDTFMSKVYIPSTQGGLENLPPSYINANISAPTNISLSKKGNQFDLNKPLNEFNEYQNNREEEMRNWADQIRTQDVRIEELQRELRGQEEKNVLLNEKIKHMQIQIQNRESEITRLQSKIDIGSLNVDKLSKDYQIEQQVEKVERLNHQIDFLTKENHQMDTELKNLKSDLKRIQMIKEENRNLSDKVYDLNQSLESARRIIESHDAKRKQIEDLYKNQLQKLEEKLKNNDASKEEFDNQYKDLEDEIKRLQQENEQLKQEASRADQVVNAYQSDKRVFSQAVESVRAEKEQALSKMEKYVKELEEKQVQLQDYEDEKAILHSKISQLQREIDLTNANQDRLSSENRLLNDEILRLKANIRSLEQDNLDLNDKYKDAKLEGERILKQKDFLQDQIERAKTDTYKFKSDVDTQSIARERLEKLYENLQKENSILKKDIGNLEQMNQQSKSLILEAEEKQREQFTQIRILQDQVKELERQNKLSNDVIDQKSKEIRQIESARAETERENLQLTAIKRKYDDIVDKQKRQLEQITDLEDKRLKVIREADQLKFDIMDKEESIKKLQDQLRIERDERVRLAQELQSISQETDSINQTIQKSKEKETEYSYIALELEKTRERERKQIIEIEALQTEVRKMEQLISQGTRQVENLNNQKEEYLKEIKELRKEMLNTKSDKENGFTKSIQLQEKINTQELLVQDLKDSLSKEERKVKNLENEIKILTNENTEQRQRIYEIETNNKQLKTIAEGLERAKEELLERLQNRNSERVEEEGEKIKLQKEIQSLGKQLNEVNQELKQAQDSIVTIDQERDEIQEQLDKKILENEKIKQVLEQYENDLEKLRDKRNELSSKSDQSVQRVIQLEATIKDQNKKIQQLLLEVDNCKYTLTVKDKELQDLANDLNVVTRENQNLTGELVKIAGERDDIRHQLNNVMIEEKKQKQGLRAVEMEKSDLLTQYKQVCIDNERLERQSQDLIIENQNLFRKAQDLEKELALLQGHLGHHEGKQGQMINDLKNMERQITFLNQKLEQADQHIRDIIQEKENIHRQYDSMMRVSQGLEGNRDEMQRQLMTLENEKIQLVENLNMLKRECEAKASELDYHRNRVSQLEEILLRERQAQHRQSLEVQSIIQERDQISRQLDEMKQQNLNLQGYLQDNERNNSLYNSAQKDQKIVPVLEKKIDDKNQLIKTLESEQIQLRQENSKLKLNMVLYQKEKEDLEKRLYNLKDSQMSDTIKSSYEKNPRQQDNDQQNQQGWERIQAERREFQKSLNEASMRSYALNQNVKNLKKEYDQVLPPSSTKSKNNN